MNVTKDLNECIDNITGLGKADGQRNHGPKSVDGVTIALDEGLETRDVTKDLNKCEDNITMGLDKWTDNVTMSQHE